MDVLDRWVEALPALRGVARDGAAEWRALDGLGVHAPVAPRQVFQSGANYRQHVIDLVVAHRPADSAESEEQARARAAELMDRRAREDRPYVFSCVSSTTAVSSGTSTFSRHREVSCLLALTPPNTVTSDTYHWNTGQTSTVTYDSTTAVRAADGTTTVTAVGEVTDGLGQGSTATEVVVEPQLSPTACATTGLEDTNGTASLVIAPI